VFLNILDSCFCYRESSLVVRMAWRINHYCYSCWAGSCITKTNKNYKKRSYDFITTIGNFRSNFIQWSIVNHGTSTYVNSYNDQLSIVNIKMHALFSNATLWKFAPLGWNTGHYDQLQRERIYILLLGRKMSRERSNGMYLQTILSVFYSIWT